MHHVPLSAIWKNRVAAYITLFPFNDEYHSVVGYNNIFGIDITVYGLTVNLLDFYNDKIIQLQCCSISYYSRAPAMAAELG